MEPQIISSLSTQHHPHQKFQMQIQDYDLGDLIEMEYMQFVNPHEVNPIIVPNVPIQSASVHSINPIIEQKLPTQSASVYLKASSNPDKLPEIGETTEKTIKLKMEEFSDLAELSPSAKLDLTGSTDELTTPFFDKDAFDFSLQPSVKPNEVNRDLKVKVEYNTQYYPRGKNMYRDLTLSTDKVQNKENCSISKVGNEKPEMYLYQPYAHSVSNKYNTDDARSSPNQELTSIDNTAAYDKTSFDSNLSVNIKHSNSTVPSPQEDQYSYISSPGNDQQLDYLITEDLVHSDETKPKLNLMIDHFNPIKAEGSSVISTPDVIDEVVKMGINFNILELVEDEYISIVSADEGLFSSLPSPSPPSLPPSTPSTTSSQPSSPIKKRPRRRKLSNSEEEDDDDDYVPPYKKKSTIRLADIDCESSDDSDNVIQNPTKKTKSSKPRGRPPKRADSVSTVSSDCSKELNLSKYRELRDKNNEASRKSRLKRRQKELEYEQEAEELQNKNIRLKAQVEELEKMVKSFRNNLFKILVNK